MIKKMQIYLIRHGKTYCNEKHLYCGKSDVDLSESGKNELINKNKHYDKCDYYFTSGLKRADSTMKIISKENKFDRIKELKEYDFGDFELKGYNDIKDDKRYNKWINDTTSKVKCPNGESRIEFKNRILKGFDNVILRMIKENKKTALGVIHGGGIGIILESMYDSRKKFYEWQPQNGEGYKLLLEVYNDNSYKIKNITEI